MIVVIAVLFGLIWYAGFISLWVIGTKKRNKAMTLIGSLFILWLIGIIIAAIQITSWNSEDKTNIELEKFKLEKEKFEWEKNKGEKNE